MRVTGTIKLNPFHRLVLLNIGDQNVVSGILRIPPKKALRKLQNPYKFELNELITLSGMLRVDFYTVIGIIIKNMSFMHAHKQDVEKYFDYLKEKVERSGENGAIANIYYPWMLLDVSYKEDSVLKIFNKENI